MMVVFFNFNFNVGLKKFDEYFFICSYIIGYVVNIFNYKRLDCKVFIFFMNYKMNN